ncbi:MAG: ABC transporter permease, partial [Planctomycetota bacterium]|nr:ABC transporter permease [Planctomycetota bacterium]
MSQGSDVEAKVDAFRIEHGLDRHPVIQFLDYIGPVNFSRDGHDWFSSPYGERKVVEVELQDGSTAAEGHPLKIDYLPQTSDGDRNSMDADRFALADEEKADEWDAARKRLIDAGEEGYPALLSTFYDLRLEIDTRGAAIDRVHAALVEATGHTPAPPQERLDDIGRTALMRSWFAWYYTEGGGTRVQNSGKAPWGGLLLFELGDEMQANTAVAPQLLKRLKVTVPLSLVAVMLSYLIALPLGIFSVRRQGTRLDAGVTIGLFILYSVPTFWAGLMLVLIFGATGLDLLPIIGLHDKDSESFGPWQYRWDVVLHCILPVATLTYGSLAYLSRQMRAGMLEVIRQDYIRTARAKGLSERVVIYKHALRNSMIPVLTLLASILPILIGGSIIVESVFDIPGMGKYAYEGLLKRDFNIVMATTVFVGIMTQLGILLSDITYSLVDPRIRHD